MNNWEIAKLAMNTGCKITRWHNNDEFRIYKEGVWYDEDSISCDLDFSNKYDWEIYQEKPKLRECLGCEKLARIKDIINGVEI